MTCSPRLFATLALVLGLSVTGCSLVLDPEAMLFEEHYACESVTDCITGYQCLGSVCRPPGAQLECEDRDQDGFGVGAIEERARCDFPASADPDDADDTVYPGAPERCDGRDNDGDGEVDEPRACSGTSLECGAPPSTANNEPVKFECVAGACVLKPAVSTGACDVVLACSSGAYDFSQARALGCF